MTVGSSLYELNDVLSAFIAVHNDVFSKSLRRIIPIPGIFRPVDFNGHCQVLAEISKRIETIAARFGELRISDVGELRDGDSASSIHNALMMSMTYCEALNDAVKKLRLISSNLEKKASGSATYSKKRYCDDLKAYRAAETIYYELGDAMNTSFSILRAYF